MAKNQDTLKIKAVLDTQEFDSSLDGMKQEFAALEKKLGSSLLSPQDQKAVLQRMGTLKKGIDGLNLQVDALGKQTGFEQLAQATLPLVGAFTAAGSALQLFGVENEKFNEIIQQTQSLTIGLLALQDLGNLKNLKGLIAIRAEKVKNFIIDKLTFRNTVKQTVANTAQAASQGKISIVTKVATKAQWLWNAAITANPIVALVVAVAALAAGIYFLVRSQRDTNEESEKEIELNEEKIALGKELNEIYKSTEIRLRDLRIEYENLTGVLSNYGTAIETLRNQELDKINELNAARDESIAKINEEFGLTEDNLKLLIEDYKEYGETLEEQSEEFALSFGLNPEDVYDILKLIQKTDDEIILIKSVTTEKIKKLNKKQVADNKKTQENLTKKTLEEAKKRQEAIDKSIIEILSNADRIWQLRIKANTKGQLKEVATLQLNNEIAARKIGEQRQKLIEELRKNPIIEALISEDDFKEFEESFSKGLTDAEGKYFDFINEISIASEGLTDNEVLELLARFTNIQQHNEELLLLYKILEIDILTVKDKYRKEDEDAEREHQQKLIDIRISAAQESATAVQRESDRLRGSLTKKEFDERKAAEEEILNENLEAVVEYYKNRIKIAAESGEGEEAKLLTQQMENDMDELELTFKDRWEGFSQDVVNSIAEVTGLIADAVIEIFARDVFNKFALLNEQLQEETETARDSLDALRDADLISEEEYEKRSIELQKEADRKENELRIKQAKAEKKLAIYQIIIDTAIAVAKSWSQGGGLFGAPIAAIAAIAGAIQLGLVASTPIPEYARGGKLGGNRHAFGGTMIEGEQGEFVVNRNSVAQPGVEALLSMINDNGNNQGGSVYNPNDGSTDANVIQTIVSETINGIASIPVTNLEAEYTKVQRKVKSIETRATW